MQKKNPPNKKKVEVLDIPLVFDADKIVIQKKHRCQNCNKLLGIEQLNVPSFDVKCERYGKVNSVLNDYARQVIVTDKNGVILFANEQVEKVTGYSLQETLGKTPALWSNQISQEFYRNLWEKISVEKKAVIVQAINRHKNGHTYKVILRISPILDFKGNVECLIGIDTIIEEEELKIIKK